MRKILYISGSRADYGLMRAVLSDINRRFKLEVGVCGMHLMPEFGATVDIVKKDNFKMRVLRAIYNNDSPQASAYFIADLIKKLTFSMVRNRPDLILLLGDRPEMLAAAIIGVYLLIPVVHLHGGDISSTVDEIIRHAITKLTHIHLAATEKSAQRIIRMGEEPWRVHVVGAPGLDSILREKALSRYDIERKYNLNLEEPLLLVIQHPVSTEVGNSARQMEQTLEAIRELGYQSIVIYPNADAGSSKMIRVINRYRKYHFIRIYKNLPRLDYLGLMRVAKVMVGNSSSGIIESTLFRLPTVNIGTRQSGRERAENVIDSDYDKKSIIVAIQKCLDDDNFKRIVQKSKSPYGNGTSGRKIVEILSRLVIDNRLLQKKITYN